MDTRGFLAGIVILLQCAWTCTSFPLPSDRESCHAGAAVPPTRVDTTARVAALRALFPANNIVAYIVRTQDAHGSEYVSEYDKRRAYISGFSGSSGTAVITLTKAAVWTDGRYFLAAEDELDCNWILMKAGVEGVPSITEWLNSELTEGNNIGGCPLYFSSDSWVMHYALELIRNRISMLPITNDLIDQIWTDDRPPAPAGPIAVHPISFAGKSWQDKISDVRAEMTDMGTEAMIVSALDEIAWLFNLRGEDIDYNPVFMSYAIVEQNRIRLYIRGRNLLGTDGLTHLNTNQAGQCAGQGQCVQVEDYDTILDDITLLGADAQLNFLWVTPLASYAIHNAIPEAKRYQQSSTIALMKSIKNGVERAGMQNAHIRDAVALISFMAKLDSEVKDGKEWTEMSAAAELEVYRSKEAHFKGLSFPSISSSGANGAVIHYTPSEVTDAQITTSEVYLLDSGGQYLDGTTDVTRTFHFGTPTDFQKEAYTRVLMGSIDLAMLIWPDGLYGRDLDAIARAPIWRGGLEYRHGTGHGIGHYLSVHEGPARISIGYRASAFEEALHEGMFFSDEPGYYEDGEFGVRLETIVMIEKKNTPHKYDDINFLGFKATTLVPFEPHLIDLSMMNAAEVSWMNAYHARVQEIIGAELQSRGLSQAYDWLLLRTQPLQYQNSQTMHVAGNVLVFVAGLIATFHIII